MTNTREELRFNKKDVQKAVDHDLKIWVVGTSEQDFSITQEYQYDSNFYFTVDIEKYSEVYKPFVTSRKYIKENRNEYQRFLNEYVAMYYVWKNNIRSKLVGFCHYRRIIPLNKVCYELITPGKIQVYSLFKNSDIKCHQDLGEILKSKYQSICRFAKEYGNFDHIYGDMEEYIDSQNVLDPEGVANLSRYNYYYNSAFVAREMFVCTWEDFDKMMRFISGYVDHILTKYNINSFDDFKKHMQTKILEPFKKTYKDREHHFFGGFICNKSDFMYKNLEDLSGNYWRIYAYVIEQLVSVFITYHSVITTNLIESIINCYFDRSWYSLYKKFTRMGINNILSSHTFDYELVKMLNFHAQKNDANVKIITQDELLIPHVACEYLEQKSEQYINRDVFFKYRFDGEGKFEYMMFDAQYMNLDDFIMKPHLVNNIDDNCIIHFYHVCESREHCRKFIDYLETNGFDVISAIFYREDNTYIFKVKRKGGK